MIAVGTLLLLKILRCNILRSFNEAFGTEFTDSDSVLRRILDEIAPKVAADPGYMNGRANTPHTARIEHDKALGKAMQVFLIDDTQLYKLFVENGAFKRQLADAVYALTNQ